MSKKSKAKGSRGERAWRDWLKKQGFLDAIRTWWHKHDVFGLGRYWEVKFVKDGFTPAYLALEEFVEHNMETGVTDRPIVAAKMNRKPWIIIQYAEDWIGEHEDTSGRTGG